MPPDLHYLHIINIIIIIIIINHHHHLVLTQTDQELPQVVSGEVQHAAQVTIQQIPDMAVTFSSSEIPLESLQSRDLCESLSCAQVIIINQPLIDIDRP